MGCKMEFLSYINLMATFEKQESTSKVKCQDYGELYFTTDTVYQELNIKRIENGFFKEYYVNEK